MLISPDELKLPDYIKEDVINKNGIPYTETKNLEKAIPKLDILYMTRVQRERFFNEADYIRLKDTYILDAQKLENAKKSLIVMHPLPRVNEIATDVDDDPRACYFKQALNGKYIRMALILKLSLIHISMTFPLIGNYGINLEDMEADKINMKALVIREKCDYPSNFRNEMTLDDFLKQQGVTGLELSLIHISQFRRNLSPLPWNIYQTMNT